MKIKSIPEDFIVKENIKLDTKDTGEYTYFILRKIKWDTVRALQEISKICRVSRTRFNFAGNKDRFAVTEQVICAWKVPRETLENIKLKDIEITVLGQGDEKINLGALDSNEFTITVRDLDTTDIDLDLVGHGFPNYFDLQRFGVAKSNHLIGLAILRGDLEGAAKLLLTHINEAESVNSKSAKTFALENWGQWSEILKKFPNYLGMEKSVLNWLIKVPTDFGGALRVIHKKIRSLFVHSYQSYLFNLGLDAIIRQGKFREIDFIDAKLAIPTDSVALDLELELPNPSHDFVDSAYDDAIKTALEKDAMSLDTLKSTRMPELSLGSVMRKAFIVPEDLKVLDSGDDELNEGKKKIVLSFVLEKGCYATMLVKCLFAK